MTPFRKLTSQADLEPALTDELAIVYKHSPHCGLSSMARFEMTFFSQGNPDVPIYIVDVIHDRWLSQSIAERFEIEHESPQVIVLLGGRPVYDASHRGVSAHALEQEIERARRAA